eukprot:m.187950 g.187950  ORF g.187950 m.187950 type:complete len:421 (+) comp10554_c1_seq1:204-1466(+)
MAFSRALLLLSLGGMIAVAAATSPMLVSFDLDLNRGHLNLTFSREIDVLSLDARSLVLLGSPGSATSRLVLRDAELNEQDMGLDGETPSANRICIQLSHHDLALIKLDSEFATRHDNTYLAFSAGLAVDAETSEAIVPVSEAAPVAVSTLLDDISGPMLVDARLEVADAASGKLALVLNFNEPVAAPPHNSASATASLVRLAVGTDAMANSFSLLVNTAASSQSTMHKELRFMFEGSNLVAVLEDGNVMDDLLVVVPYGSIVDFDGNEVSEMFFRLTGFDENIPALLAIVQNKKTEAFDVSSTTTTTTTMTTMRRKRALPVPRARESPSTKARRRSASSRLFAHTSSAAQATKTRLDRRPRLGHPAAARPMVSSACARNPSAPTRPSFASLSLSTVRLTPRRLSCLIRSAVQLSSIFLIT